MPKGVSIAAGFEWFGPEFNKRTEGRYKVEIYPSSTLVSIPAQLDSVKSGVCEIVMSSVGGFPRDFPLTAVVNMPTLALPAETVEESLKAFQAGWEFYNTFPEIQAEFKPYKLIYPILLPTYHIVSKKKEIHSAADFRGMKIGGSGAKMELVTANGGAAVQQVPPMAYANMDKGVIDAAFITFSQVSDFRMQEIADYFYNQDFGSGLIIVLMNWNAWNALSPQDQKIMGETWADAIKVSATGSVSDEAKGKKAILDASKKITNPTAVEAAAWAKGAEPATRKWRDDAISAGVDSATVEKIYNGWLKIRASMIK